MSVRRGVGSSGTGAPRHVSARQGSHGMVWSGLVRHGLAGQGSHGAAGLGRAWTG